MNVKSDEVIVRKHYKVYPEDEKTNISFEFSVNEFVNSLFFTLIYDPKTLGNTDECARIVSKCIWRDGGNYDDIENAIINDLPLKNLITLSVDSPNGYRGASHNQDNFKIITIGPKESSPGFINGEIESGVWKITLNVHALVSECVDVQVNVTASYSPVNYNLFPCELHCHTIHSDGGFTPQTLVENALARGLQGINLTDHNTSSGYEEIPPSPLAVVKGIEWTTYFGHMLVLGANKFVDWRDAVPDNIDEKMKQVKDADGLIGIAHPFQFGTPICTGGHWDFNINDFSLVDYIEIWSEGHPYLTDANIKAINLWHSLLDKGYRIAPTFGRDWHRAEKNILPTACTLLLCAQENLTPCCMLNAIKDDRTVVTVGPEFSFKVDDFYTIGDTVTPGTHMFSFMCGSERLNKLKATDKFVPKSVRLISNNDTIVGEYSVGNAIFSVQTKSGEWYSAELWGSINGQENNLLAVTAPVYIK